MGNGNSQSKTIAALVPNITGVSPGQRVRIELWEKYLKDAGWTVEFFPFEDDALHEVLYKEGNTSAKTRRMLDCYQRQLRLSLQKFSSDVLFIFREISLIGPALPERLVARQKIPIIYDIDDPIFVPYRSPMNNWASLLKFSKKTHKIFELSSHIIAINRLIADYAAQYNPNVTVIPNCIDIEKYTPRENGNSIDGKARLVWIGSESTMPNLQEIAASLRKIQAKTSAPLIVIGAGEAKIEGVEIEMRQWSAATEVSDLQDGDIGLLPLSDLEWNNWKFFFKAIQYMAVGIPVIARRMGSNDEIIEDGVSGFVVETEAEWFDRIALLLENHSLRKRMGEAARRRVIEKYSTNSQMPRMVEVFENVLRQKREVKA